MELLEDYRVEIDKIDREITQLLEKRMNVAKAISKYKMENNMQIFHPDREKMVIEKNKGYLENKEYEELVESFYDNLMYLSRLVQQKEIYPENKIYTKPYKNDRENLVVGYQGVAGSFGNEAMLKYFKNIKEAKSYEKFEEVFKAVESGEIEYGILPVENSSTGGIGTVEDLLKEYNLYIVGEECIKISQNLVGIKGATVDDIKEVYSHPQGFEQSTKFFDKHKNYNLIPYSNTAISAKLVSDLKDKSKAAIASERAAKLYDLKIIKKDVNDLKNNYTRFIVIGRDLECDETCDKVSILFSVEDTSGGLYNLIRDIKEFGLNMSKIESRPNRNNPWNYIFFVDFDGNLFDENIKQAVNVIARNSKYFKLLGCYRDIKCK
ncbi:chorismate mutase [Clostridium sp. 2218st1_F5_2218SCRN_220325]|mgnify:FL=1|uniref:chorismate mutase n=1 Tax=Clostridium sp. 2218st1_F5_2218SCRN_220325 TaxID=3143056 RepID=UPI0027DAC867|nr:chorismate mutase [uncultured Intestinibacter sp.]